ncbi:uncharacterized protein [Eurosta solidaginis]|uniref:uncharacterized protein n=1 Tax=Eurosta solidaginis TaxID=178769 RepID=UPI003530B231
MTHTRLLSSMQIWSCITLTLILFRGYTNCDSFCKFTNIRCHSYDETKIFYKACHLIPERGEDGYATIHAVMREEAREANISIRLLRRANGWKPFLYNVNIDGCKFMRNPKANSVVSFFYSILKEFSNINHTCPYNQDLIVNKFHLTKDLVKLPFPIGEYALDTVWRVNGQLWTRVNASCKSSIDM